MRKKLVIEMEVNGPQNKDIINKIVLLAVKVLRASGGNLLSVLQEDVYNVPATELKIIGQED